VYLTSRSDDGNRHGNQGVFAVSTERNWYLSDFASSVMSILNEPWYGDSKA
jgi:hypothetical protein